MTNAEKNRKQLFILATVAISLCLVMFIPFGKTLGSLEKIVKFLVLPIVVAVLNLIITLTKFREYRPTNRFQSFASYAPIFAYYVSTFVYLVFLINRADPTAVLSYNAYIIAMILFGLLVVAISSLLLVMDKINLTLTKNQVNVLDVVLYISLVVDLVIVSKTIVNPYTGIELVNSSTGNIVFGILLGLVVLAAILYKLYRAYVNNEEFVVRNKQELIDKFENQKEMAYADAELIILHALNNYTDERYIILEDEEETVENVALAEGTVAVASDELDALIKEVKELKHEKKQEVAKHAKLKADYIELQNKLKVHVAQTELDGLNKQSELLDASIKEETTRLQDDVDQYQTEKTQFDEKVAALQAEKVELLAKLGFESIEAVLADEAAKLEAKNAPKPKVEKPEKVFVPAFNDMLAIAQGIEGENLSSDVNPAGTQYKFVSGKKPFLLMQKTSSDYRVTFCVKEEDILEYLTKYPGVIEVAKSPKGGNFLKIANTGELDTELLTKIIKESLPALLDAERKAQEAKEAEAQAKLAAKEEEKRQRALLKEAERIVAKARREEEKAAAKAQKEAEKAAAKAAEEETAA